jgi:rhodanese-related sulfurtransferase
MTEVKRTLLESGLVVVAGLAVGLSANALNPEGLTLSRDYFHKPNHGVENGPPRNEGVAENSVFDYLRELGLQPITHEEVVTLFRSPSYEDGLYVFVDARNGAFFTEGHVPGAYQLDHYRVEHYIDTVLKACAGAEKIVVYCNGGKCEDSEFAAGDLFDHGVDPNCVFIYAGGFETWAAHSLPIERGPRLSGQITGGQQP